MSNVVNEQTQTSDDLVAFHKFIGGLLANGSHAMAPEEALDLWRAEHPLPEEFEESVAAIRDALDDLEAGDLGQPIDEFDTEFRARNNLPPRQ